MDANWRQHKGYLLTYWGSKKRRIIQQNDEIQSSIGSKQKSQRVGFFGLLQES